MIELRNRSYSALCLGDVLVKLERHLPNSMHYNYISRVNCHPVARQWIAVVSCGLRGPCLMYKLPILALAGVLTFVGIKLSSELITKGTIIFAATKYREPWRSEFSVQLPALAKIIKYFHARSYRSRLLLGGMKFFEFALQGLYPVLYVELARHQTWIIKRICRTK